MTMYGPDDASAQLDGEPSSAPLEFRNVSMTFPDGTHVLENINLRLDEGDLLGVVGPSGCGKSTLLRMAAGLLEPSSGEVALSTEKVGVVFQDPTLLPWRTVLGNVELMAELEGQDRSSRRATAQRAIELVGLTGFERHKPVALSGGMKMRVSLARTLAIAPSLLLFDEPFGALDEITRERMGDEFLALAEREKFTGMLITHSIAEAVLLCSRVAVLSPRPGRLVTEHRIDLPHPRTAEIRYDASFTKYVETIARDLRRSMG